MSWINYVIMTLGIGCVHPPGEGLEYDGFFYRACEMNKLAEAVKGKPLLLNHNKDYEVGTICEAWIGSDGQLNVLFELSETFNGYIAHGLISKQICHDLSLGHDVQVDWTNHRVLDKTPTEVSICVNGARNGTHISMLQDNPTTARKLKKTYIYEAQQNIENKTTMSSKATKSDVNKDSEKQPKDATEDVKMDDVDKKKEVKTAEDDEHTKNFKQELLDLVTKQRAEVTVLENKFKEEQSKREAAEKRAQKLDAGNKRKRKTVIEGAIAKMLEKLLEDKEFSNKLGHQRKELDQLFAGMKESEDATPVVDLIGCCASQISRNTRDLEVEYQRSKRLKKENDTLQARLEGLQKPALEDARERFGGATTTRPKEVKQTSQWSSVVSRMPRGMKPVAAPRDGAAVRNPNFWKELTRGGTQVGTGMGHFDEYNLIGRDYQDGQAPRRYAQDA